MKRRLHLAAFALAGLAVGVIVSVITNRLGGSDFKAGAFCAIAFRATYDLLKDL